MTEKQAKEILDFLAQKIGFYKFEVDRHSSTHIGSCYLERTDATTRFLKIAPQLHIVKIDDIICKSKKNIKLACLEKILDITKNGQDVVFSSFPYYNHNIMFLPKHSTLESLLMQMDLEM